MDASHPASCCTRAALVVHFLPSLCITKLTMAAAVVQAPDSALQDSFKALELSYGDKQFAKQQLSVEEKQASDAPHCSHAPLTFS